MKRYLYRREDVILETALPSPEPGRELLAVLGEDRLYALPRETVFIGNAPPCQLVAKDTKGATIWALSQRETR